MTYRRSCSVIGTFCIATIFNGYINLLMSLPFVGNLPVQFSYENETHPLRKHNLHRFGLRPKRCRKGISPIAMVRPDVRRTSRLMPLESASPLEKGLDPKPSVIKTGRLCELSSVELRPKTVSLTNSLTQLPRGIPRPRRTKSGP